MSDRLQDLIRFYSIMDQLEKAIGGARALADCRGRMKWPARGVYFFREAGENRSETGEGPRVGTHALKAGVKSKRTVFYSSGHPPDAPGCVLTKFETSTRTNWHLRVCEPRSELGRTSAPR